MKPAVWLDTTNHREFESAQVNRAKTADAYTANMLQAILNIKILQQNTLMESSTTLLARIGEYSDDSSSSEDENSSSSSFWEVKCSRYKST